MEDHTAEGLVGAYPHHAERPRSPFLEFTSLYGELTTLRNLAYGIVPRELVAPNLSARSISTLQTEDGLAQLSIWSDSFASTFRYLDDAVEAASQGRVGFEREDWNQGIVAARTALGALDGRFETVSA
jgi:hypothetical protein